MTADPVAIRRWFQLVPAEHPVPTTISLMLLTAALCAVATTGWAGGYDDPFPGLPRAGWSTELALPVARATSLLCAMGTIGLLALRLILLPGGSLPDHVAAAGTRWGSAWAVTTGAWGVLSVSEISAVPVWSVPERISQLAPLLSVDLVRAQVSSVVLAIVVAVVSRSRSSPVVGAAALLACVALVLPLLTGHVGHQQRGVAVGAVAVHAVSAALWSGCLLAVVVHLRHRTDLLTRSLRPLSRVSLTCAVLVVLSGVATAAAAGVGIDDAGSPYGRLLLVKVLLSCVLLGFGGWHRWSTLPAALAGSPGALRRLAAGELAVMGTTFGVASTLAATTPPWA